MKRIYLSFSILFFLCINIFEQNEFIWQKPKATSNNLNDVWATHSSFFVMRIYGIIISSTDNRATWVNNFNSNAGSYKVEFNGSKYPSGIYFYQIQAGSYFSVRKMVLLK